MFSTRLENFLPFSSTLKLSSANSFSLEESEFYRLWKGITLCQTKKKGKLIHIESLQLHSKFKIWYGKGRKHCAQREKMLGTAFSLFPQNVFNSFLCYAGENPFPKKLWFLRVCSTSLLKTLLGKEKLLVTSNFSFSNSVFCLKSFLPFSSNLKLSSANSFSLEESKICHLGKG